MSLELIIFIGACMGAFMMAFSNGANDVANAFAAAVGSKALTIRQAIFIAALLNLLGAMLLGSHVAGTLINGVIQPAMDTPTSHYIAGMASCLLASATFVLLSTFTGMPVSSTHSIVGSLTGVGLVLGGPGAVNWSIFGTILLSWLISPFVAVAISLFSAKVIQKMVAYSYAVASFKRLVRYLPLFAAFPLTILIFSILEHSQIESFFSFNRHGSAVIAILSGGMIYLGIRNLVRYLCANIPDGQKLDRRVFKKLQLGSCCMVAFAHGSNDVSNSISPALAIFFAMQKGVIPTASEAISIPTWILLLGGVGMSLGIAILGYKVMLTLGQRITLINHTRGFCVDFSTANTVLIASLLGLPVSSTHAATGSIIGVGLAQKRKKLNLGILAKILTAWVITVPAAAGLTFVFYWLIRITLL